MKKYILTAHTICMAGMLFFLFLIVQIPFGRTIPAHLTYGLSACIIATIITTSLYIEALIREYGDDDWKEDSNGN